MKVAIRYFSRGGSTKKLANAIGQALAIPAASITTPLDTPVDLLLIGGAPYVASQLAPELKQFIHQLTFDQVKHIAVFSTSNWKMSIKRQVERSLTDNRIRVVDEGYRSRGALGVINKTHPTAEEQTNAIAYVKKTMAKLS